MFKLIFRITLALVVFMQSSALGQGNVEFERKFKEQQILFTEKIYVHTDKAIYFANDIIWFKVYNLSNIKPGLSDLSKVVYVELIDSQNKPQAQVMVAAKDGTANGNIQLSNFVETGTYKLRAYTNLMKNAGAEFFFEKEVNVINPLKVAGASIAKKHSYDISFFPEGGHMVEGLQGNIAFKAQDNTGAGVKIKGVVIDNHSDTVATISTLKFGIGKFAFTPKAGRTYKAICIMPDKEILIKELPAVEQKGYTLNLAVTNEKMKATVATNMNESYVYVVVHNGKSIATAKSSRFVEGKTEVSFDEASLSGGLYHLTVFDTDGHPVAERVFFRKIKEQLGFTTELPKLSYTNRAKVDLKIAAIDEQLKMKAANASIAIYKIDSLQTGQDIDIVSDLYLRSELKGAIENPSYYFSSGDNEVAEALDQLLLTQGWRKFEAKKQSGQPVLRFLPEYNGHLVSGKVTSEDKKPVTGLSVYLSSPKKTGAFSIATTDSLGRFLFNTKNLFGKNEVIIQADYTKDSTSNVLVSSPYFEEYTGIGTARTNNINLLSKKKYIEDYYFSSQVQEAYSKKLLNSYYMPDSVGKFYGLGHNFYKLADYTKFSIMEDVFREYVNQIHVFKKKNGLIFRVMNSKEVFEKDPLILYDGIPYFDVNKMMAVYPDDVESVEIFTDRYHYGGETYEGVVEFYSKKATLSDYVLNPKAVVIDYEGMQLQREFYAPKYDAIDQKQKSLPDYRNVLYWEPNLLFNGKDKTQLSFYTSDMSGKYIGVVQGVSTEGTPGFKTFEIEVKAVDKK